MKAHKAAAISSEYIFRVKAPTNVKEKAMLEFNIPKITSEINENEGTFVIEPLEGGYGTTIGNALRRVMLASLPGTAVKYIKINGVLHEFSSVPGVREDVTEIVLNVKGIIAKTIGTCSMTGYIDFVGPGEVTAGDIRCDSGIEIINRNHHIATVEDGEKFYMELCFAEGNGYTSASRNKAESDSSIIGTIFTDSIYTPVISVSYLTENTRVENRTDLDKLTVKVKTNGSITPTDAMAYASKIIISHFEFVAKLSDGFEEPKMVPDEKTKKNAVLETAIEDIDLSVRSFNCLKRAGINMVGELTALTETELGKIRNLGKKSCDEIKAKLIEMGLSFSVEE